MEASDSSSQAPRCDPDHSRIRWSRDTVNQGLGRAALPPAVMRDRKDASLLSVFLGGDRETRDLVLWLLFGAAAVIAIGGLAVAALLSRPVTTRYSSVAAIPALAASSPAPAIPDASDEAALSPAPSPIRIGPERAKRRPRAAAPHPVTPTFRMAPPPPKRDTALESLPLAAVPSRRPPPATARVGARRCVPRALQRVTRDGRL